MQLDSHEMKEMACSSCAKHVPIAGILVLNLASWQPIGIIAVSRARSPTRTLYCTRLSAIEGKTFPFLWQRLEPRKKFSFPGGHLPLNEALVLLLFSRPEWNLRSREDRGWNGLRQALPGPSGPPVRALPGGCGMSSLLKSTPLLPIHDLGTSRAGGSSR